MSPPRKRLNREEKRAATRSDLLRAARDVFGRRGYQRASLEEIAEEAGFSKGALYYNFEGKEDLFLELLEERLDKRLAVIRSAFAEEAGGSAEHLRDAARRYVAALDENREWLLLYFEFWAHAVRDDRYRSRLAASLRSFREGVQRVIEHHADALGVTPPLRASDFAIGANALAVGIAMEKHADPDGVPDELFGDMLTYLFEGALASGSGETGSGGPQARRGHGG